MPTPMSKFAEIARRFRVDSKDDQAIDRFFESEVHEFSSDQRSSIFEELLEGDGQDEPVQSAANVALPTNVRALPLASAVPVVAPARALDPLRDGDEPTLVLQWMQRWLNDFLRVSGLGVIADVSLTETNCVQVALRGPAAPLLESGEPLLLESMKQLTSRVAEVQPELENLVDFVVHSGEDDDAFFHGLENPIAHADGEPRIIRMEQIAVRAMSTEAAAETLQGSADEFIVFRDVETHDVSVIYKRRDRNLGLIAPDRLAEG